LTTKSAKRTREGAKVIREPMLVIRFDDGSTGSMPAAEVEKVLLLQYAAMATSASPRLRAKGEARLRNVARIVVGSKLGTVVRTTAAQEAKRAQRAASLAAVRHAFHELEPRNQGRNATSLIASKTSLGEDMVRVHLKTVREEAEKAK
jgi:hypothetical protein